MDHNIYKKYSLLTIVSWLSFYGFLQAQPRPAWDKTYGGADFEELHSGVQTLDKGFVFAGQTLSKQGGDVSQASRDSTEFSLLRGDMWVVRTDSLGVKLWDKRYGGNSLDRCWKIIQNTSGYLLIGQSNSTPSGDKTSLNQGNSDFWVVQIRPDGEMIWEKSYGGAGEDIAFSGVETADGGYLLYGHSNSNRSGDKSDNLRNDPTITDSTLLADRRDLWLVKIDSRGNKLWDKSYGGIGRDHYPKAIVALPDGNFLIGCNSDSPSGFDKLGQNYSTGFTDIWIIKIDANGNRIWDKTYGGNKEDELKDIRLTPDGNILLCGSTQSDSSSTIGNKRSRNWGQRDYWILKINPFGDLLWEKTYGGKNDDDATVLYQNSTGYSIVGGVSNSPKSGSKTDTLRGGNDYWFLYLDQNGNKVWDRSIGGAGNDNPEVLLQLPDKTFVIGGFSSSDRGFDKSEDARGTFHPGFGKYNDMWIAKIRCIFDINIGNDTFLCKSAPLRLEATIPRCPNCKYFWYANGSSTEFSRDSVVIVNPTSTTRYNVAIEATDACTVADEVEVVIIPAPDTAGYLLTSPRCHNGNDGIIALNYARGGTPPYSLVVDNQVLSDQIFINNLSSGSYTIRLLDAKKCYYESTLFLKNPDSFHLKLPDPIELNFGDSFRLRVQTNHVLDTFFWSDPSLKRLDTMLRPYESRSFSITAIDTLGCKRTAATTVTVRRTNDVYSPNIFSPNNDGKNDYFALYGGKTVVEIRNMKVFDRWGDMVFQSPKVFPARDDASWDGFFNGKQAPIGVYIFFAEVFYIDGHTEIVKGDVTLIR
jgi:gliding motility-associated-like protein